MPALETDPKSTRELVYAYWKSLHEEDGPREHLGASVIGKKCARDIWYGFRWAGKVEFEGRMYRLFEVGHKFEDQMAGELRAIGMEVVTRDDRTISKSNPLGDQYRVSIWGGHFGGSMDGACKGVPEAGKNQWHVAEFKTHNDKSFKELLKIGVELAKYQHYVQMQIYMGFTGMHRALYIAENKNTSELYFERVKYNEALFATLIQKADNIIFGFVPPGKISNDPDGEECRYCDHKWQCQLGKPLDRSCRTCIYSEPLRDGTWVCNVYNLASENYPLKLSKEAQIKGCDNYEAIEMGT